MHRFNPFRPNEIIHPGMFAGRIDELVALEKTLFQTQHGNPTHFLIDGERGIGKSSLLLYLTWTAKGEVKPLDNPQNFNFMTVSVCLGPSHTYPDIVQSIASELSRQISERAQVREFARSAWDFIKKWEVGGIRFREGAREAPRDTELVEDLSFAISESLKSLGSEVDGILILIDEADKPPVSANLGTFAKLLTERLKLRGCDRVCIGLAGLTAVRDRLRKSHESSLRLFKIFALDRLSMTDCAAAIQRGLEAAKRENGFDVSITPEAEGSLSFITEGYPHFIQQFAYCAFDADSDNNIDIEDVQKGAYGETGALKQLGLKYRQVLRVMAEQFDGWVTKAEIRKKATAIKASTLDNALVALKSRGVIVPKPGTKGTYKLPSRSFAVWIRAYTQTEELISGYGSETNEPAPGSQDPTA